MIYVLGGGGGGGRGFPQYTYTGQAQLIDDGNKNWRIKFLSSGTLTFVKLNGAKNGIDVFMVGGGGGGCSGSSYYGSGGAGGGGGYTTTKSAFPLENVDYPIVIGAGGAGVTGAYTSGSNGGNTSAFGYTCAGGGGGVYADSHLGNGGNGGSGGGTNTGGTDGGNGTGKGGYGQRNQSGPNGETGSTREFGESSGDLYSSGGKQLGSDGSAKLPNTGDGGDGRAYKSWAGGSGIIVIRNKR